MAEIALVNPRFEVSYWGLEYSLPLLRKRAAMPVASLPLLAALTPPEHQVAIFDENVEPLDFDRIARADLVGITGMNVQRSRMRQILMELKRRDAFTVVGGPWVSVRENYFGDLADVIFVGEAEETWPLFLREWDQGDYRRRYEQADNTDMTQVPAPRYDLLKMRHYLFGSVQLSRGCPFQCEFCDIIVVFGRRPRLKTSAQIRKELDNLRTQKMEIIFIVDDNLIGNKKAIKEILRDIATWQRTHGFPFIFVAEASLDLAEDDELMQLMVEANILSVFIGIESPNEASLRETKKFQNLLNGNSLLERVHKVQDAGLEVWCGMILGFDHDNAAIFDWQRQFLQEARIAHAMIGMLSAIPKTPLYDRLAAEGRLDPEDESEFGTNVIPLRMSREELRDGYVRLMQDVYDPENYFARVDDFMLRPGFRFGPSQAEYRREHFGARLRAYGMHLAGCVFLYGQLLWGIPDASLRAAYRRRVRAVLKLHPSPTMLFGYLLKCVMHFHHYRMAHEMAAQKLSVVNPY